MSLRYAIALTAALASLVWSAVAAAPRPTVLTLVPPIAVTVGHATQLVARLACGEEPVAGMTVTFAVGEWSQDGWTDALGFARVVYRAEAVGEAEVRVRFAGTDDYAEAAAVGTLSVQAPPPTALTLRLEPNPVAAGDRTEARLVGERGQDCTAQARFGVPPEAGGTWDGAGYTSRKAGEWKVTGTFGTLGASTVLVVRPGAVKQVWVAPESTMVGEGELCTFTVTCSDSSGNRWQATLPATAWRATIGDGPASGSFDGANGYTPGAGDRNQTVTIRCTVDGVESEPVEIEVHRTGGRGLVLAWDKDTREFYLCANPTNPSSGRALEHGENIVGPTRVTVSASAGSMAATVTNVGAPDNSLRVRWQARGDGLAGVYQYSTVAGKTKVAAYARGKTNVDGALRDGFWGLTHRLDAGAPKSIVAVAAPQR